MDSVPSPDSFAEDVSEVKRPAEVVLLAVFSRQELMTERDAQVLDIRNLVREHPEDVDTAGELKRLSDERFVEQRNDDEYRLTTKGLERCLGLIEAEENDRGDELSFTSPDIRKVIYNEHIPKHQSYLDIINEINGCYRLGYNTSVAVLVRRLFEDLTWEMTTSVYNNMDPFLTDDKNPVKFGSNIKALEDNPDPLRGRDRRLSNSDEIKAYLGDINTVRKLGNDSAHGVKTSLSQDDLDAVSSMVTTCVEISYSVLLDANRS